jgi:UDP-N-acetylglucosamine 2-epimerase (non-hydrolysing)
MLIDIIAGARPNFMKIAPIIHAIKKAQESGSSLDYRLIHTGQHYDKKMSGAFFEQLEIPEPDINLESGSGTQAEQTGRIMVRYEAVLLEKPCDITLVVGDVTSTMACSIAAKKLGIRVAHVEAGIRSFDISMPEEINRMVTDSITDYFFTTTNTADDNLKQAGIGEDRIFRVGNTMIDTLLKNRPKFTKPAVWDNHRLKEREYILMTMHRPANVDGEEKLKTFINKILESTGSLPVVFPIHPRTAQIFERIGLDNERLLLVEPLPYLEFNYLTERALAVITDSGGITEETTVMKVPCMTLRDNTERPETCEIGTNELIGTNPDAIAPAMNTLLSGNWKEGSIPDLWDGKTAERITKILESL